MSTEERNPVDGVEDGQTVEEDPLELEVSKFRKQMENGDFVRAKAYLEDQIKRSDGEVAQGLKHHRIRLRLDGIAIAVMAICGGLLTVVLAISLFH